MGKLAATMPGERFGACLRGCRGESRNGAEAPGERVEVGSGEAERSEVK